MATVSPVRTTSTSYKTRARDRWIELIDAVLTRKPKSLLNDIAEDIWGRDNSRPGPLSGFPEGFKKEVKDVLHKEKKHFHLAPPEEGNKKSVLWMNLADYIKLVGEAAVDDTEEPSNSDDDQGGTSSREHSQTPLQEDKKVSGTLSNTGSPSTLNLDKDAEIERLKAIIQGLRDTINQQGALNEQQGALYEQQGALINQQNALINQQKALINQQGALNVQPLSAQFSSMSFSGPGK
ncbi:hypothetical protein BV898_07816 [Hypsibius exemplaris]|uniref:Uncharacterized protein n=1 Tax=Hypsibius exemplaris TaxID=2072580 RepID=A0A1W0WS75_HYPEX|nr:hypothetical protein BV898_07816 [Hypsibius exemplaris]